MIERKRVRWLGVLLVLILCLAGCNKGDKAKPETSIEPTETKKEVESAKPVESNTPLVTMKPEETTSSEVNGTPDVQRKMKQCYLYCIGDNRLVPFLSSEWEGESIHTWIGESVYSEFGAKEGDVVRVMGMFAFPNGEYEDSVYEVAEVSSVDIVPWKIACEKESNPIVVRDGYFNEEWMKTAHLGEKSDFLWYQNQDTNETVAIYRKGDVYNLVLNGNVDEMRSYEALCTLSNEQDAIAHYLVLGSHALDDAMFATALAGEEQVDYFLLGKVKK